MADYKNKHIPEARPAVCENEHTLIRHFHCVIQETVEKFRSELALEATQNTDNTLTLDDMLMLMTKEELKLLGGSISTQLLFYFELKKKEALLIKKLGAAEEMLSAEKAGVEKIEE